MIPTGIYRQVPIKHWLPTLKHDFSPYLEGDLPQEVITGYKIEEAWYDNKGKTVVMPFPFLVDKEKLRAGQEVKGFVWKPIAEVKINEDAYTGSPRSFPRPTR